MNFLIAVGIAIAYLALGFLFAIFVNEDEETVAFDVFLWPLLIASVIIIVTIGGINEVIKAIYRRIKRR